jgi:hypothetical protein
MEDNTCFRSHNDNNVRRLLGEAFETGLKISVSGRGGKERQYSKEK